MTIERNSKMFYLIAEAIEEYPSMHDQAVWYQNIEDGNDATVEMFVAGRQVRCGTAQCVAGWAIVLDGRFNGFHVNENMTISAVIDYSVAESTSIVNAGAEILGLTKSEASELFYTFKDGNELDWPNALRDVGDGMEIPRAIRKNLN
jgi:hypothetical protein